MVKLNNIYIIITSGIAALIVLTLSIDNNTLIVAEDKPKSKNIWELYSECDIDVLPSVLKEQLKERYPFEVRLAYPTYIPEGYRLIAMDFIVDDNKEKPNGYVLLFYWNKGDCMEWMSTGSSDIVRVGGFTYSIILPREKSVPKGTNDAEIDNALQELREGKVKMVARPQVVTLSNGYRAFGWEPFMGIGGVAMVRCPEYESKSIKDTLVDDKDSVTCIYDDGSSTQGYIEYNTTEDRQAGLITYLHEEYNLRILIRGDMPLYELAKIAGSVKIEED